MTSLKGFAHLDRAEFGEIDIVQSLENTLALLEPEFRGRVTLERDYAPVPRLNAYGAEAESGVHAPIKECGTGDRRPGTVRLNTKAGRSDVRISG